MVWCCPSAETQRWVSGNAGNRWLGSGDGNKWLGSGGDGRSWPLPPCLPALPKLLLCDVFGSKKKSSRSEYQFAFVLSSLFFFHCSQKSFCRQPRDHHMLFAPNLLVLPCRTSRAPARDVPGAFNLQNCLPRRIAVNIGECRSGGESCPPAVLVIHRSPSHWGNEEKLLGLEFCSLAARS